MLFHLFDDEIRQILVFLCLRRSGVFLLRGGLVRVLRFRCRLARVGGVRLVFLFRRRCRGGPLLLLLLFRRLLGFYLCLGGTTSSAFGGLGDDFPCAHECFGRGRRLHTGFFGDLLFRSALIARTVEAFAFSGLRSRIDMVVWS